MDYDDPRLSETLRRYFRLRKWSKEMARLAIEATKKDDQSEVDVLARTWNQALDSVEVELIDGLPPGDALREGFYRVSEYLYATLNAIEDLKGWPALGLSPEDDDL